MFNIGTDDEVMPQTLPKSKPKPPKAKAKATATSSSSSSSQTIPIIQVMDESSTSKRAEPETRIEPKGKAGRTKRQQFDTSRPDGTKRDKESAPEDEPKVRKKRTKRKTELELGGAEADDETDRPNDNRRKNIPHVVAPATIGVQRLREEFVNAKNKDMITQQEYEQFDSAYRTWFASKGNDAKKKQMLKNMRDAYRQHLWKKLKDAQKN